MPSIASQLNRFAAHVFLDLSRCVSNCGKAGESTEIRVSSKGGYIEEFYIESPEISHQAVASKFRSSCGKSEANPTLPLPAFGASILARWLGLLSSVPLCSSCLPQPWRSKKLRQTLRRQLCRLAYFSLEFPLQLSPKKTMRSIFPPGIPARKSGRLSMLSIPPPAEAYLSS